MIDGPSPSSPPRSPPPGSEPQGPEPGKNKPKGFFEALGDLFKGILQAFGIGGAPGSGQDQFQRGPDAAQRGVARNRVAPNPSQIAGLRPPT